MTKPFTHAEGCTESRPLREFTGHLGDAMRTCPECRRYQVAPDLEPQEPEPEEADDLPGSRYRCGWHLAIAVRPNGKGCPICEHHRDRQRRKREDEQREARREVKPRRPRLWLT